MLAPGHSNNNIYRIRVRGQLKPNWVDWLQASSLHVEAVDGTALQTSIQVEVADQAALRGALNRIWDLNLTILEVRLCTEDELQDTGEADHAAGRA